MSDWFKDLFIGEAKAAVISKNNMRGEKADIRPIEITENGTYEADGEKAGYSPVTVNVPDIPAVVEALEVTENGTYTPGSGVDGFNKVTVNVPDIPAVTETLEVTENGTYIPSEGVDGFSEVEVNVSGPPSFPIGDGNTHIWISLPEGRTSPSLGVTGKGTVTVDWGDGTTPEVLNNTSLSIVNRTNPHEYGKAGDYIITLTVDGQMGLRGISMTAAILAAYASTSKIDYTYTAAIRKFELGNGVTYMGTYAFANCYSMSNANIPNSITSIVDYMFYYCYSLKNIVIPDSVTSIGNYAFMYCRSLTIVNIPGSVTSIGNNAFMYCSGVRYYDFSKHTSIPTLGSSAFIDIASDCEIRVPAALVDEWKAATNWSTYADKIVGV